MSFEVVMIKSVRIEEMKGTGVAFCGFYIPLSMSRNRTAKARHELKRDKEKGIKRVRCSCE